GVTFDDVQRVAVKVPSPVEPRLVCETGYVHDERFAFPAAARPPHPEATGTLFGAVHVDDAARVRELVGHQNVLRRLDNLERVTLVGRAWHTRQVALDLRVTSEPVFQIVLFPGERLRPIGKRTSL